MANTKKKGGITCTKVKGKREQNMLREAHRVHKTSIENKWADEVTRKELSQGQITAGNKA